MRNFVLKLLLKWCSYGRKRSSEEVWARHSKYKYNRKTLLEERKNSEN